MATGRHDLPIIFKFMYASTGLYKDLSTFITYTECPKKMYTNIQ